MSNHVPGSAPRPRSARGEGGLGARLEATLKERAPQPKGKGLVMLVLALAVYLLIERIARRLLPLAALFRLSLVFPDQTPSR